MDDSLRVQLLKFVVILAVLFAIACGVLKWLYVDIVTVNHDGMAPTIFAGDQVLVWRSTEFDHGDIILCRHPRTQGAWVLGRIVGRPGMNVSIIREQLTINNQTVQRDFQGTFQFEDQASHALAPFNWGIEELGEVDHYFMEREDRAVAMRPVEEISGFFLLSDNRTYVGEDSRAFGPVRHTDCVGYVFMRLTSSGRAPDGFESGALDFLD